jgi:hypothetical protein
LPDREGLLSDLKVHFAADETVAYLDVPKVKDVNLSLHDLETLIKRNHITVGVNDAILAEIVQGNLAGKNIPIAVGRPMKAGVDGHLEWFVDYAKTGKPKEVGDRVDHRELLSNLNISKGEKFARIVKAVPGTPGLTVTGAVISPPEVSELPITIGKGVVDDAGALIAKMDGAIKFNGIVIEVCDNKTIFSDIDYSTGNVTYNGCINIQGTVRSGFKVTATGDILIYGDVEDAEIKSGGSVSVRGGVAGTARGTIECTGSINLKHVAYFNIIAGKEVTVSEDALHTAITADGNVSVKNVVGGVIHAPSITAEAAGCATEIKTILDISQIDQLIRERYDLLKQFGILMAERATQYGKMYSLVYEGMDDQGFLNEQDQQTLESLKSTTLSSIQISARIQARLGLIEDKEKGRQDRHDDSFLKIGRIFPGVIVKTGTEERIFTKEEQNYQVGA